MTDTAASDLVVMKFGGSSIGSAARIEQVVRIVTAKKQVAEPVIVLSAVGDVTDRLDAALREMSSEEFDPDPIVTELVDRHGSIASALLSAAREDEYRMTLNRALDALRQDMIRGRGTALTCSVSDRVLSVGERLSAPLLAGALSSAGCPAAAVDAAELISTVRSNGEVSIDMENTQSLLRRWQAMRDRGVVPVVTGFIGGTADGETTTLGRGGSDYSAAIVARALQAPVLERWTDVDGLYTEDPHQNGTAEHLRTLTYEEALERTHRGEFGMHPCTLDPLTATGTEVHVRGTLTPNAPGTVIRPRKNHDD